MLTATLRVAERKEEVHTANEDDPSDTLFVWVKLTDASTPPAMRFLSVHINGWSKSMAQFKTGALITVTLDNVL